MIKIDILCSVPEFATHLSSSHVCLFSIRQGVVGFVTSSPLCDIFANERPRLSFQAFSRRREAIWSVVGGSQVPSGCHCRVSVWDRAFESVLGVAFFNAREEWGGVG